jgi:segregation and condensation protein B
MGCVPPSHESELGVQTPMKRIPQTRQMDRSFSRNARPFQFRHRQRELLEYNAVALDLAESVERSLAEFGRQRLEELAEKLEPSWQRRPQQRRLLRPVVPSSASPLRPHPRLQHSALADAAWDDQAEREARGLVALLFVAGGSLRRAELAAALRVSAARVDRACAFLRASPPHGLALLESGDEIQLVSAPDCGPVVERFLDRPPPDPLSPAALEVLSIVAYEQPVTRADISHIRGTDSSGVIETLLARGLIADDPRFGARGRPSFLVTTPAFLRLLGLASLAELPPRLPAGSTG